MACPHCTSTTTTQRGKKTQLGYWTFRCHACRRIFNERTGTPYNFLEYPTDIVLLVVLWRVRYKLSLRDLAEMFLERGLAFTHEAVRDWEARLAPLLAEHLRAKRTGQRGSPGMSTTPTSQDMDPGATCIARLTGTATWSTCA